MAGTDMSRKTSISTTKGQGQQQHKRYMWAVGLGKHAVRAYGGASADSLQAFQVFETKPLSLLFDWLRTICNHLVVLPGERAWWKETTLTGYCPPKDSAFCLWQQTIHIKKFICYAYKFADCDFGVTGFTQWDCWPSLACCFSVNQRQSCLTILDGLQIKRIRE